MTLTELKYIVAVADERHFRRAAQSCFVTQSTLSAGVKKIEDELGIVLFERYHHEILVTTAGKRIIEQARKALEEACRIKEIAQQSADPLAGPLRIGAIYTVGPYLFPHLVPTLREAAPNLRLYVEENYTANLTECLRKGRLDVIIISLPLDVPGIVTQALYDEPFVVLIPSSHPLCIRESLCTRDLVHETVLLLGPGHCFRDQVLEFCPSCISTPAIDDSLQQTLEASSLETIRHMVASGVGITVLPCSAAGVDRYSQRLITIKRFSGEIPKRRIALAWRSGYTRTDVIELLRDSIHDSSLSCINIL